MRHLLSILFLLFFSVQLSAQVLINEFSSSNIRGIKDEDGDHSDWIELFNSSALETSLDGYHLSDNTSNLTKWTFPAISLRPGNFLLIFASGKNRTEIPLSFQTIIQKGADWKYIVPSAEIGSSWRNTGFDDSSWSTGPSGFGYGDNDDSTVLNNILSVFIRKEFVVNNLQDVTELILSIDYDDGFVAYINGHEIARSNLGTAGSEVAFNQSASVSREATMYSGGTPENYTITNPGTFLVKGVNVIAIQGHNNGTGSSDLSLIPMLTLGLRGAGYIDNLPPYIKLTGNKLHANFKISKEGETLILSKPDSSIIDSVPPIPLAEDVSYGRKPDGIDSWVYFASPTPGSANITNGDSTLTSSDTVKFSVKGGYFPGAFELQLSSDYPSDSIFYTINGSEPTLNDSLYKSPVQISTDYVVRARVLNYRKLPGVISTNTYITKSHTLPVICLSTNPENLWDYNTGIYVLGPNAAADPPNFGANFWQDWERKAHMELYDKKGVRQIDQDIGIKIFGNWSRAHPQKSLALYARSEYGKGSFHYKFFNDKPIEKFEAIVLRNGGNDWDQGILRDGLTSTLVRDMDIDRMAFQPSIVYINGVYWGILNIREKVNSNFISENHNVNPDNVNLLENNASIIEGTNASYNVITNFLSLNTLETERNYLQVSPQIDINNYIQYQLTQIYINNKDWPGNNIRYWNTYGNPGTPWRWIIFDTDFGFSIWDSYAYTFNTLSFAMATDGPNWPNPPWSTLLFRRMLTNPGFKNEFINQYADRINTTFSSAKINATVDSLKQLYMPEINDHLTRWALSYSNWQNNITLIKNYANYRPSYARDHLKTSLGLDVPLQISVDISNPGSGKVRLNSIIPDNYPFSGVYFKNVPIKLTAIPAPGYKFVRWEGSSMITYVRTIEYDMKTSASFRAVFEYAESSDIKIVINEINYNSSPDKDTKDWIELYNAGNASVNLKNWIISDAGPESGYIFSSDLILTPDMYIVVCRDVAAFRKLVPDVKNVTGDLNFGLSSSGDDVNLYDPQKNLIDFLSYTPNRPWPTDANGTGASIALTSPFLDNNAGENWKSSLYGGTPGERNFVTAVTSPEENPSTGSSLTCFPNPFHDYTTIRINVSRPGKYKLEVYDLQGRLVKTLADQILKPGPYSIDWAGNSSTGGLMNGGIYIIRLSGANQIHNLKVVFLQ
jgi:hypothetical protein